MPTVTFENIDGTESVVDVDSAQSLMEIAVNEGLEGIDGECGGACACATCHVEVAEAWYEKVGKPEDMELDMLDFCEELTERSRLGCQVFMTDDLDGLRVRIVGR
ncbi:MAG: 2Fe-2S iron-sulfur cluster-binding protein [Pseudomonadota bacterium]